MKIRILLLFATLTVACVPASLSEQSGPDKLAIVTLSESQNGSTIELSSGSKLVVRLPAQMGTGYVWAVVKQDEKVLRLAGKNIESNHNLPGGTDAQVFDFSPVSVGSAEVEFAYKQPWQRDQPPARTFRFHVVVRN